jgi:hypothetical protein
MGRRDHLERLLYTFRRDDAAVARRDAEGGQRVLGKYKKLRKSPYKLFRATNPTFIADLESLPEYWRMPGHEIAGPLLGDAHPENFGAVGASAAEAQVDCTDFDVVVSGPLARDLARAACGLAVAELQRQGRDPDDKRALDGDVGERTLGRVRRLATTWAEQILTGTGKLPDPAAFAALLRAVDVPADRVVLDDSTHVLAPHPDLGAVRAGLASYAATTLAAAGAQLEAAWRLHGKGASSFAVDRVIVRLALAGGARRIVEWKPQADAPAVCQAFRERRNPATCDPLLGLVSMDGVGHVAQRWLVEEQKVKSRDLQGAFADDVAQLVAVRLADMHRRHTPLIIERVRSQPVSTIADALADLVAAYVPVLANEWRAFVETPGEELLRRLGLGPGA